MLANKNYTLEVNNIYRQSADRFFGELFFTITINALKRTAMRYRAISYINLPKTYNDSILAQFVVHHATDSNRTIRVECLRCHHTCQIFKCRFAVGQLSVNCWYTAGRQLADSIPTVGQQVFWGALLHNYHNIS